MISDIKWFVGLAIRDPDFTAWLAEQGIEPKDVNVGGQSWVAVTVPAVVLEDGDGR